MNLAIKPLQRAVHSYCTTFLEKSIYGECKAFCPFHNANNNNGLFMCSDKYIRDNPEKVSEILKREAIRQREVIEIKVNITNNIPKVNVTVNQNNDGSSVILLFKKTGKKLGDFKPGETVKLGNREYSVLDHGEETTAIIAKEPTKSMTFGKDGDYAKSDVRAYCNGEFYKELCKAVGKHNIVPHTVNLVSDDGSNNGATVKDNVSILTCDLYRRYREFLPAIGSSYWTATRVTTLDKDHARYVCSVRSRGRLCWYDCVCSNGVRPFCILNSSVLVD